MAQNVVDFSDNPTGAGLMDDYLDKDQQNVLTSNSGIQRPSYAVAGTKWLDTSATPWVLKMYDGTSDVALGTVNPTTHAFIPYGVDGKQDIANISQTLDNSTTKYPSNNAVKTAIDAKANDSDLVHNTGDEIISGIKNFQDEISAPNQIDYTNITNCITEIPQDIKVEINSNGKLVIKAGSYVYVPNGVNNFAKVAITSDIISDTGGISGLYVVEINSSSLAPFAMSIIRDPVSGATAPSSPTSLQGWYDTTNNVIKRYNNGWQTWMGSFPIALVTSDNTNITSIDQVFNGFGYIGSTVFALPGVKGLIPNGRNADGSLKNIEFTTSKVSTIPVAASTISFGIKGETGDYIIGSYGEDVYDDKLNIMSYQGVSYPWMIAGTIIFSNNTITSFTPKTAFHAVDYNDKETVVGWSMPDYSAGISVPSLPYTATKNGYIYIRQQNDGYITVNGSNVAFNEQNVSASNNQYIGFLIPVSKNDVITSTNTSRSTGIVFYPLKGV